MKPGEFALLGLETAWMPSIIVAIFTLLWILAVITLSLLGWAISSLNVLAGWTPANLETRLRIVQGILCSIAAGGVAAVAGMYYNLPLPLLMLCVFFAGMLGDKFLKEIGSRLLGRLGAAFDVFFGKNGDGPKPPHG